MKILLVSINAKYIHSNPAIRSLKAYAQIHMDADITLKEFTINQQLDIILREIYKIKPDVIGFSCYIWNYEYIKLITRELKKLLISTVFILGGPEVSYNPKEVIEQTGCDIVVMGEGEKSFCECINAINTSNSYFDVLGIAYRKHGETFINSPAKQLNLDEIPFIYEHPSDNLPNHIIYYEASRGCPFKCQYCLSGDSNAVRYLPLSRVYSDLQYFLNANVKQVKFVDRTFNSDKNYAMAIWRFLSENDNFITNFHFEIAAELLDSHMITFLNTVRKGLFQFEIGVQSTNKETLAAIKRITLPDKLTPIINSLQSAKNINLHLDLIAGLPYETYEIFKNSFNYVYSLRPNQLQLGFLKLLKGSGLYENKSKYGLLPTDYAPYEVIATKWLSYNEILALKMMEDVCETYYNSGRFNLLLNCLLTFFKTPFDMFEALGNFYEKSNFHMCEHSKVEYYDILYMFFKSLNPPDEYEFKWFCLYDIYSHEKAKKLPSWLDISTFIRYKNKIFDFIDNDDNKSCFLADYGEFDTKQIMRMVHVEVFPFNPVTGERKETAILFNYAKKTAVEISIN